jgi:hypothetical protein
VVTVVLCVTMLWAKLTNRHPPYGPENDAAPIA